MYLTNKQLEMIAICAKPNEDGSVTDLDQILQRVSWKPTKNAIHFSIRALIARGLIEKLPREKRRGRVRTIIGATDLGKHFIGAGTASIVSSIEDDNLSENISSI